MNYHQQILDSFDALMVFSLDKNYQFLAFSQSYFQLIKQLKYGEIKVGDRVIDNLHTKEEKSAARLNFDRALSGETFKARWDKKVGDQMHYFEIDYTPLKNENEIIGLSALLTDITQQKETEQKRQHSEEMFKKLFFTSKDAIMTLEPPSWKFTTGNSTILDMFKVKDMEEWVTIGPWTVSPEVQPDGEPSGAKAQRMIQTAMETGSHFFEWTHQRRNGENFPATVLLTRVDFEERQFLQATVRDVTQQKETEAELQAHSELQNILMKTSSRYINTHLADVDEVIGDSLNEIGELVGTDRAFIFDYKPDSHTISNLYEYCAPHIHPVIRESQNLAAEPLAELLEPLFKGQVCHIADTNQMPDGPSKSLLLEQQIKSTLAVPMIHDDQCIGLVGFDAVAQKQHYTNKEITVLRLFADMLVNIQIRTEKQKELEKLLFTTKDQNKRLKEFSYITSHNMRASVANLMGLSQMISVTPDSLEYLDMLKVTTQKLDSSISNINELINFENENDVLKKVECNLSEAIQRVLKLTNQIIQQKKVELSIDIADSFSVRAFPAYLDSIFHNLITNALKYGITDTSKILAISAVRENPGTCVSIRDEGLGIDLDKFRDKLFKLGTRLHDTSNGQGLGLFMTKRQLEAMGGRIEVISEANAGTTFKLHFQD